MFSAGVAFGVTAVVVHVIQRIDKILAAQAAEQVARVFTHVLIVGISTAKIAYIIASIVEYVRYVSYLIANVTIVIANVIVYVNDFLYVGAITASAAASIFQIVNRLSFLTTIHTERIAISLIFVVGNSCVITGITRSVAVVIVVMEEISFLPAYVTGIVTFKIILVIYVRNSTASASVALNGAIRRKQMGLDSGNLIAQITNSITLICVHMLVSASAVSSAHVTVFVVLVVVLVVSISIDPTTRASLAIVAVIMLYSVGV